MSDTAQFPKLTDLIQALKDKNIDNEKITGIVEDINSLASTKFYTMLLETLSKDEIQKVNDEAKNQEEANETIARLYREKTGEDAEEVKKEIIESLANEYLIETDKLPITPA